MDSLGVSVGLSFTLVTIAKIMSSIEFPGVNKAGPEPFRWRVGLSPNWLTGQVFSGKLTEDVGVMGLDTAKPVVKAMLRVGLT